MKHLFYITLAIVVFFYAFMSTPFAHGTEQRTYTSISPVSCPEVKAHLPTIFANPETEAVCYGESSTFEGFVTANEAAQVQVFAHPVFIPIVST
jgi:hypothetical protein